MQLMRRGGGDRICLNLVARSLGYNVKSNSGQIQSYGILDVSKWLPLCVGKSRGDTSSSSEVLESRQREVSGWGRISYSNAVARSFERDHWTLCCSYLEQDKISIARLEHKFVCKCVRSGPNVPDVLGKHVWKADSRMEQSRFGMDWRGCVRCLHTEVKGTKPVDEKTEEVSTVSRVRSTVKVRASTQQRKRSVGIVVSTPIHRKNKADLNFPRHGSGRDEERDNRKLELGIQGAQKLLTEAECPSTELQSDNHEETQKRSSQGQVVPSNSTYNVQNLESKEADEMSRYTSAQAMSLLRAALDEADVGDGKVEAEFQRSLRVGIVGAPNAGKSLLTNQLVGTRVSAVSRKTNTTHREHLGVFTKSDTQLLYYDTPGLHLDIEGSPLRVDAQHRVRNAWEIVDFCETLVVLVDAERQIRRPDKRVQRLVEKLGTEQMVSKKRVLCLNKVDLIEQKRLLLPLAKQFEDLLGYDRIFMISGLTGSGVNDVKDYLLNQAVLRPWDEDPELTNHRDIALEIVREQVFDHLHEELPHTTKQKLISWKVLKDGSIRIQQLLLVAKKEHQKILVGKNGAIIGDIGIKARKELQQILGVTVHLVLDVKPMTGTMTSDE